jgi:hypothetical protein
MSIEQNLVTLERARQQWNAGNLEGYLNFMLLTSCYIGIAVSNQLSGGKWSPIVTHLQERNHEY